MIMKDRIVCNKTIYFCNQIMSHYSISIFIFFKKQCNFSFIIDKSHIFKNIIIIRTEFISFEYRRIYIHKITFPNLILLYIIKIKKENSGEMNSPGFLI